MKAFQVSSSTILDWQEEKQYSVVSILCPVEYNMCQSRGNNSIKLSRAFCGLKLGCGPNLIEVAEAS